MHTYNRSHIKLLCLIAAALFVCPLLSAVEATLKATAEAIHKTDDVHVQYVYCSSRSFIGYTLWDVGIIMLHFLNKVKPCTRLVVCMCVCLTS